MTKRQQLLEYKGEMIWNKDFRKIQGKWKFNHEWNRSLGRTDHTSETSIKVKEKTARREILDQWLMGVRFRQGKWQVAARTSHFSGSTAMNAAQRELSDLWRDWGALNEGFLLHPIHDRAPNAQQDLWCLPEQCEVRVRSDLYVHSCEHTTAINHPAAINLQSIKEAEPRDCERGTPILPCPQEEVKGWHKSLWS